MNDTFKEYDHLYCKFNKKKDIYINKWDFDLDDTNIIYYITSIDNYIIFNKQVVNIPYFLKYFKPSSIIELLNRKKITYNIFITLTKEYFE